MGLVSGNIVGAKTYVMVNGRVYGEVIAIKFQSSTPVIARMGLDSPVALELSPTVGRVSGTISLIRRHLTGAVEGRGVTTPFRRIPEQKYFSLVIVDRASGNKLHKADLCMCTSQEWTYAAKMTVQGVFTFDAIDWSGEVDGNY